MYHKHGKPFIFKGIVPVIGIIGVVSLLLLLLWNWLMPAIFGLTAINYWQAIGLLLLSKILFSGFHGRGRQPHMSKEYWRKRFEENNNPSYENAGTEHS